jgi:hypothetical protein
VSARLEALDVNPTPLGDVAVWRQLEPTTGGDDVQMQLGDENPRRIGSP